MSKDKYSSVIDFGSSEFRLGVFNKNQSKLYFNTKRIMLAKERLEVLNSCNCKEYISLKNLIYKN